ncbi:DNA polymerase I [Candidatus Anaplasma sp. TIGMIC]|uniref:DNA polymerase I n=1 Tax=Candidatus Anaplasma sp. TIGMIC TaxID=3020713 RepID=UPI0023310048|nr:DNA polymerase I [Candidatus Anaplasma sp. TIGMIC]MDB1135497.1 DNA polymerase I [Candidatus Anaplasma sp. TIGMIC]
MVKSFVVIDAYGFLFRAYYALPGLSTSYDFPVGGVYGFINILLKHLAFHPADYLVVVFDSGSKNFRHEVYPQYKSNRPKAPEELSQQCAPLREAVSAFNIASEEVLNYEADDVIATLSSKYASKDVVVRILTADKDLLQLLGDNVQVYDPIKSRFLDDTYVLEKFGVPSEKLLDVMALTGDASDNIPGVPSIGIKTAAKLINEFGSLDNVLRSSSQIAQKKCREMLTQYAGHALLSRDLVALRHDVKLEGDLEKYARQAPDVEKLMSFLAKYELTSLESKVAKYCKVSVTPEQEETVVVQNEDKIEKIEEFLETCIRTGTLGLYIVQDQGEIEAIYVAYDGTNSFKVTGKADLYKLHEVITPLLQNDAVLKVVYDAKSMLSIFPTLKTYDDVMIMSYSLDASSHDHGFDIMSQRHMGKLLQISPACMLIRLHKTIMQKLFAAKLFTVYYELERPLVPIIHKMQEVGIRVDVDLLNQLGSEFTLAIQGLEENIYSIAGVRFNIASSQQLGKVLFEKLRIGGARKTPSGSYCTNAEVLTACALEGIEIADKILKWRHYTKLRSTYTDALTRQVNQDTGRVHTCYSMISTATGRISSSNPNLQNIPIRSKDGEKIRQAFIAREGHKLIAADYSQMELRILAHIADVKAFRQAFIDGLDIHSVTARQIFGEFYEIDSELRRRAKSINFGIIYGMGPFRLAKNIGINRKEASQYVEQYFRYYPEIKRYMETTKAYARKYGYTNTVFGRKCFIDGINSRQRTVRGVAERAAINAPIQGTAADVVKKAMIRLQDQLPHGVMVLQVHDELLVEVPEEHVESTARLMKEVMEGVVDFSIFMEVDVSVGDNWGEMEKLRL